MKGVNFDVKAGEVHALVGENGAGKSTLIKILMGAYSKDAGTISIEGKEVEIHSPLQAKSHGLVAVYQDVMLARHLSVGENFEHPLQRAILARAPVQHVERNIRLDGA